MGNSFSVEKRLNILLEGKMAGNVKETCARHGISRNTYYRWQKRHAREGLNGLQDRSRGPRTPKPRQRSLEKAKKICLYALEHPGLSIRQIADELKIGKSTVHETLARSKISTCKDRYIYLKNLIMRNKNISKRQEEFCFSINPALKDIKYAIKFGILTRLKYIWQFGVFPVESNKYISLCVATSSGDIISFSVIDSSTLKYNIDALKAPIINSIDNLDNIKIFVHPEILKLVDNGDAFQVGPWVSGKEVASFPFGMLAHVMRAVRKAGPFYEEEGEAFVKYWKRMKEDDGYQFSK